MKILLVSDIHHFSTVDVFNGYIEGFRKLQIPFDVVNIREIMNLLSADMTWGFTFTKALNVNLGFTHIIFVSGLVVPQWVYKSLHGRIKVGVIGLDDPHASTGLMENKEWIDFYFTNEKTFENKNEDIYYLPTATAERFQMIDKSKVSDDVKNDLLFVGTVYKDREKPLEKICEWCEANNKKISIYGGLLKTAPDSIIRKYAQERIINNQEAKVLYQAAEVCINLERNILWNPNTDEGNPSLVDTGKEPYSSNPRGYELGLCKTLQLYVDARESIKDIFGDNVLYASLSNVKEKLEEAFNLPKEKKEKMVENCHKEVMSNHLYVHRANKLVCTLHAN